MQTGVKLDRRKSVTSEFRSAAPISDPLYIYQVDISFKLPVSNDSSRLGLLKGIQGTPKRVRVVDLPISRCASHLQHSSHFERGFFRL